MFTDSGDLYFIDFDQAGFLPLSFMAFALVERWPIGFWIKDRLCLPDNNVKTMDIAAYYFMIGVDDIGKYILLSQKVRSTEYDESLTSCKGFLSTGRTVRRQAGGEDQGN